jgi:hypothetical protein
MYKEHGRYKNDETGDLVYSETEISYNIAILNKLRNEKYKEDRTTEEKSDLIKQHYEKAMFTMKTLLR